MSTYPAMAPASMPPRERSSGAKVLLAIGLVMAVLGGVLTFIGFGLMADGASSIAERADEVRDGLEVEIDVPGRASVDLVEETYTIYVLDPFDVPTTLPDSTTPTTFRDGRQPERPDPTVRIIGPDGQEIPQRKPGIDAVADLISGSVLPIGVFRAPAAGTYTVVVTSGDAEQIGVGQGSDGAQLISRTVGGGVLGLIGMGIGGLGVLLAIGGLVWLLTSGGPPRPLPMPTPVGPGWAPPPAPPGPSTDRRPPPPVPPGPAGDSMG